MNYMKNIKKVKLRKISEAKTGQVVGGVTIPRIIYDNLSGCYFNVSLSGNAIILESGCANG